MKLFSLLNPFVLRRNHLKLQHDYNALQVAYDALNEATEEFQIETAMKEMLESPCTDPIEAHIESLCSKCPCGGTIMPLSYEHPEHGSFCNKCDR